VIISLWLQLYQQNLFWIRVQCGLIRMWMCLLRIWLFFLFFTFFCHMIKWCFLSNKMHLKQWNQSLLTCGL
jgi:hypothetical protein